MASMCPFTIYLSCLEDLKCPSQEKQRTIGNLVNFQAKVLYLFVGCRRERLENEYPSSESRV